MSHKSTSFWHTTRFKSISLCSTSENILNATWASFLLNQAVVQVIIFRTFTIYHYKKVHNINLSNSSEFLAVICNTCYKLQPRTSITRFGSATNHLLEQYNPQITSWEAATKAPNRDILSS